jgi:hypothetical protein
MKTRITAVHPAFGEVCFEFEAKDGNQAFSLWKSIVFSPRQWSVRKNSGSPEPVGGASPAPRLDSEDSGVDDI